MEYSVTHPHEPEIPPALDSEGRCRVCGLMVQRDEAEARIRDLEAQVKAADRLREAGWKLVEALPTNPQAKVQALLEWEAASNHFRSLRSREGT